MVNVSVSQESTEKNATNVLSITGTLTTLVVTVAIASLTEALTTHLNVTKAREIVTASKTWKARSVTVATLDTSSLTATTISAAPLAFATVIPRTASEAMAMSRATLAVISPEIAKNGKLTRMDKCWTQNTMTRGSISPSSQKAVEPFSTLHVSSAR